MSEFERIEGITARFAALPAARALEARGSLGVGARDDAAVLVSRGRPEGALVVSVDASVEGVHFDLRWLGLDEVAERATEAALSDLAAMGADACAGEHGATGVLCAWTLPGAFSDAMVARLTEGVARAAQRAGCPVLGGNLSSGPSLALTTTVLGRIPLGETHVERAGARVGDALYLTGPAGRAALGLRALRAGRGGEAALRDVARAWRAPRARLDHSAWVRREGHACVDVSDGLAQDAGHLARASGVRVELDAAALRDALDEGDHASARALRADALSCALYGGEDYELLIAARPGHREGLLRVGTVHEGEGVWLRDARGEGDEPTRIDDARAGWNHFRARA